MKVNHFNTYPHGGAANAALRIHDGLVQLGIDSNFFYRLNDKQTPTDPRINLVQLGHEPLRQSKLLRPFQNKLEKRRRRQIHQLYNQHLAERPTNQHEVFSMARLPERTYLDWRHQQSDLVHLHWLAFLADYPSFFASIPDKVPIVWTLHDMSAFTGGCHYASDCDQFTSGCGNCPQVVSPGHRDVSADSWSAKKKSLQSKSIHVAAPGKWLIELAKRSPIWPTQTEFSVIHYGLDLSNFKQRDQRSVRQSLQIQPEAVLIGFGADDLTNRRKGFSHLINALQLAAADKKANDLKIELAVFGDGNVPDALSKQYTVHHFGFVQNQDHLVDIYSACDFVVVPSLEDNQPQVGLEAMACGRPVIGFDAGGIPEYVIHERTGILVPPRNDIALAKAIVDLASAPSHNQKMGHQSRLDVEQEFEIVRQSQKYAELYEGLTLRTHPQKKAA